MTRNIVKQYLLLLLTILFYCSAAAQDSTFVLENAPPDSVWVITARPQIVLALSGGGARGLSLIGVIKALEEAGIPIDGITGSSIGAVIGGLYAAGNSVAELEQMATTVVWSDIFWDVPARKTLPLARKAAQTTSILELRFEGTRPYIPSAVTAGQKLSRLLVEKVSQAPYRGEPDFSHLKIPFAAVSTDLNTGESVVFREGSLSEAMFASMAFPLLIAPVHCGNRLLIDGGVAENIPVPTALEMSDFVIAVDATTPTIMPPGPHEPWEIANQVIGLMQQERKAQLLQDTKVVIIPLPDSLSAFSFTDVHYLIEQGYQTTKRSIPSIREQISRWNGKGDTTQIPIHQIRLISTLDDTTLLSKSEVYYSLKRGWSIGREHVTYDLRRFQKDRRIRSARALISGGTLIYQLETNPLITSISCYGSSQFTLEELKHHLLPLSNADTLRFSDLSFENVLRSYRSIGNPLANIITTELDSLGNLRIRIDEGQIHELQVEGADRTSPGRIKRDFNLRIGQPLKIKALTRGLDELYGSDLFDLVRATVVDDTVTIKVVERPPLRLRFGAGVDSDRKGRGLFEISYQNTPLFSGSVTGLIKYGEFDERYEITYRNLAIFRTYMEGSASVASSRTEYHYYDTSGKAGSIYHFERLGASVQAGQQFRTWGRVLLGLEVQRIRTDYISGPTELDLRKLYLRSEFDTQDRTHFPTSGFRYDLLAETAASTLGGSESFNRLHLELQNNWALTHRLTFSGHLQGGICDEATPFSEWFRLGGEPSFYGLHEGELAGRHIAALNVEVREDLISRFLADAYVTLRGDLGKVGLLEKNVSIVDLQKGVGLSFALDTLLGPMSLSFGHLFEDRVQSARNLIYFNFGYRF